MKQTLTCQRNALRTTDGNLHSFYNRLYERNGRKGMKAIVAVMRKMLCLIYTLWKNDTDYDPNHQWIPKPKQSDIQETGASFVQNLGLRKEEAQEPPHKIASA